MILVSCGAETTKISRPVTSQKGRSNESIRPTVSKYKISKDHTYKIDISKLSNVEKHFSFERLQDVKNVESLFQNSFSKQMNDEEMKTLDSILTEYVGIFKLYARNQAELIYMFHSLVGSMRGSYRDRSYPEDYYYPYQYIEYGIQNDFENISMTSYFLSSICLRPVQVQVGNDPTKLSVAVSLLGLPFDPQKSFGDAKVVHSISFESRCSIDISSMIKKTKDIHFDDENRQLDVVSEILDDGRTQILTVHPTDGEKLKSYFGNSILIIDSDQGEWKVRSISGPESLFTSGHPRQTIHVCVGESEE